LESLQKSVDSEAEGIDLARALINLKSNWATVVPILQTINSEPEDIRYLVLKYASSVMLGKGAKAIRERAYQVIVAFSENFYETKKAGLISACYEVLRSDV